MEFSMRDPVRYAVEVASAGENTVMYDAYGNPNIMVRLCKYDASCIDPTFTGVHPAFVLNDDITVNEIWVSKYKNTVGVGGVGVSAPGAVPTRVSYKKAREMCKKKGKGWHLMTNLEYMALISVPYFQKISQYSINKFSTSGKLATVIKDVDGNEVTGGRTAWCNIGRTANGVSDICSIGGEYVDGLYVGGGEKCEFTYYGNGKVTQNRIIDEKYMLSKFGMDSPGTDAESLFIDTIDGGYIQSSKFEKRDSPLSENILTYSDATVCIRSTENVVIPQDMRLNGVYPTSFTTKNAMISLYLTKNTNAHRIATRGYSVSQTTTVDVEDVDFVSLDTDTDSKYFNYFRAVYIDY